MCDYLGILKHCALWVPHNLTDEEKRGVKICTYRLKKVNRGCSSHVWDCVTGKETWVFQCDPETKQQSAVRVFPVEAPPVNFKQSKSIAKQFVANFFSESGCAATIPLQDWTMVNSNWCINHCWPKVLSESGFAATIPL